MREAMIFHIDGKELELVLFQEGDRVRTKDNSTMVEEPTGTVESTECGGLFVNVIWDKEKFTSIDGEKVSFGRRRMVDGIDLITD